MDSDGVFMEYEHKININIALPGLQFNMGS